MIPIQDLDLFKHLVATGSMSKTGRYLGVSPTVVSKRLSALEDRLGTRLFYRPSARLELTASGRTLYDRSNAVLAQAMPIKSCAPANDNALQRSAEAKRRVTSANMLMRLIFGGRNRRSCEN
jgi:DNA-binding transcriptional LysR family regulator